MPLLKLSASKPSQDGGAGPPPPPTPGGGGIKLKLSTSQPQTPANEAPPNGGPASASGQKKKQPTQRKTTGSAASKKRTANDDISPAAKRLQNAPSRKPSLSLRAPTASKVQVGDEIQTPLTAGGLHKIKLGKRKQSIQPRVTIDVKRRIPPRQHAVGYDSEDSETEKDPAVQNAFILRMQPGEDADYLRDAITNGKIGVPVAEGGAQVTLKFIGKDQRRAIVRVKDRMYAAVLVDLPCIVESMKSWDKKGWWKVADICQMLLVLGLVSNEDEAKNFALPKEVEKGTMQYAHGLTPPMHWVRKRRFRKRVTQKHTDDIDARVKELLDADEECEKGGGTVQPRTFTREQWDQAQNETPQADQYDDEMDAEGEAIETTEGQGQEYDEYDEPEEEVDIGDMEADLQAAFDMDAQAPSSDQPAVSDLITESPINMADQAASFAAVENQMLVESPAGLSTPAGAETPAGEPATTQDEESEEDESDYDDDESDADVVDEDAAARAAEKQQQLEEVADLEREIANVRQRMAGMTNQLLRNREMSKLRPLEDSLRIKRDAFGLNAED